MSRIVNLTPHSIILCGKTIEPSGLARCETSSIKIGEVNGIAINRRFFGQVSGLPEPQDDVFYIVSSIVAQAVRGLRKDCLVVDETIRDEAGRIVGCKSLARV